MRTFTIHALLTVAFVLLAAEQAAAQPTQPIRVLAIGDSILHEARHPMLLALGSNAQTRVYSMPGSALCSFFDESLSDSVRTTTANNVAFNGLRKVVADFKPHAIVMQFWGNDNSFGTNPCMQGYSRSQGGAYFTKYRTDTTRAMELVQLGARDGTITVPTVFWVQQPPEAAAQAGAINYNPFWIDWNVSLGVTNTTRCFAEFPVEPASSVSAAAMGGDRYGYVLFLPCLFFESTANGSCGVQAFDNQSNRVRDHARAYGSEYGIHFCPPGSRLDGTCEVHSSGALRYGFGIANAVLNKFPNGAPAATTPRYACN